MGFVDGYWFCQGSPKRGLVRICRLSFPWYGSTHYESRKIRIRVLARPTQAIDCLGHVKVELLFGCSPLQYYPYPLPLLCSKVTFTQTHRCGLTFISSRLAKRHRCHTAVTSIILYNAQLQCCSRNRSDFIYFVVYYHFVVGLFWLA